MAERELHLTPRLACIAELVPRGARLADVGTDHAYLPAWLLQSGRIDRAIAFYEKIGFRADGAEKELVLGTPVTVLRMALTRAAFEEYAIAGHCSAGSPLV